jgi:hypothetical protein
MGVFEYIGVLTSVIMGLGITHLATGLSKLIQNRQHIKIYLPQVLWTLNVLVYILMIWWGMYWWGDEGRSWSVFEFFGISLYAIVLFLMSALLYPYDLGRDFDARKFFFCNRTWFFSLMLAAWLLDIPETLIKGATDLRDVPADYAVFVSSMIGISIVGILSSNHRVHLALPVAWLMLFVSYMSFTIVGVIAG